MSVANVTVFGGSGFVGRHVVRNLARAGANVRVAVRHPDRALFLKSMGDVGQITPIATNIRDDASVTEAVTGSDAVINLVGVLYEAGRQTFDTVHHKGSGRIARAAKAAGVRQLVQVSAIGADIEAGSKYARSKAAGEAAVRAAFPSATVIRPSIVFGADDNFFNLFAALARLSPVLPLIGGGNTRFQPVYVGDVAAAITEIVFSSNSTGTTYELGGPENYTFKELMEILLTEIKKKRFLLYIPFSVAKFQSYFLQMLPKPLLTVDQVELLKYDSITSGDYPSLNDLGVVGKSIRAILPKYIYRFRTGGQFG